MRTSLIWKDVACCLPVSSSMALVLQISLLSPHHSAFAWVDMDNVPQEQLTPTPPLLREQSYTDISRTSIGCFVKEDSNNVQYTRMKERMALPGTSFYLHAA